MLRGKDHQRSPTTAAAFSPTTKQSPPVVQEEVWEVRPSGMLVQKRTPDSDPPPGGAPVPTIRVKVKFAGVTHEVYVNSQASFGELKKLMAEKTGRHPDDLKVVYKDKERDAKEFLDMVGVKDRSRVALLEDPEAQARRLIEERKNNKERKAALAVNRVSMHVDELAAKVAAMAGKGAKVVEEAEAVALTEALMNELVKLDAVAGDGDVRAQRRVQEKRVQKLVETLDGIRAKAKSSVGGAKARQPHLPPRPTPPPARASQQHQQRRQFQPAAPTTATAPKPQTATASWDSFDLLSSVPPPPPSSAPVTAMAPAVSASPSPRFEWELF